MGEAFKYQSSWKTEDSFTESEANTLVSSSYGIMPQYSTDPALVPEKAWILKTTGSGGSTEGMPMGMLLALTYSETVAGGTDTYQFSYRTKEGTTIRTTLI